MKAFLGINFVNAINKLPLIAEHWREDNPIGNNGIQNNDWKPLFWGPSKSIFCR